MYKGPRSKSSLVKEQTMRRRVAENLKEIRLEKGLTQAGLARLMRVQQPKVAFHEKFGPASLASLQQHCEALGVIFDWQLIDTDKLVEPSVGGRGPYAQPRGEKKDLPELPEAEGYDNPKNDKSVEQLKDFPEPGEPYEVCKVHGTPLTKEGKCLQKGCKYG